MIKPQQCSFRAPELRVTGTNKSTESVQEVSWQQTHDRGNKANPIYEKMDEIGTIKMGMGSLIASEWCTEWRMSIESSKSDR